MPMLGEHQAENAATAIAAVELFLGGGKRAIADEVLRQALADTVSPGRLHVIEKDPLIILDGAHNPHGIRSLRKALGFHFPGRELVGVVATLADKDWHASAQELSSTFNKFIITQAPGPRALSAAEFATAFEDLDAEVIAIEPDPATALELLKGAMDGDSVGVITGSLYMVGEVLGLVRENSDDE
jgi:dihydrofolate synthase/folylpolyglutamate synthase